MLHGITKGITNPSDYKGVTHHIGVTKDPVGEDIPVDGHGCLRQVSGRVRIALDRPFPLYQKVGRIALETDNYI